MALAARLGWNRKSGDFFTDLKEPARLSQEEAETPHGVLQRLPIGGVKGATEGALARHPPRGELALLNTVPPLLAAPRAALTLELGERRGHRA